MDYPQQPDLFGVVHVEAQHVKPGARVKHGPVAFTVTEILTINADCVPAHDIHTCTYENPHQEGNTNMQYPPAPCPAEDRFCRVMQGDDKVVSERIDPARIGDQWLRREWEHLAGFGWSDERIARHLGIKLKSVQRRLAPEVAA